MSVDANRSVYQKVGIFLSILVDTLNRLIKAGLSEPVFNKFEKSIIDLLERVKQYLKDLDVDSIDPK